MFSSQIEWYCAQCQCIPTDRRKYCTEYHSMLTWSCTGSGKSGLHTNYYRHHDSCNFCTPELEEDRRKEMDDKQAAVQQHLQALDNSR